MKAQTQLQGSPPLLPSTSLQCKGEPRAKTQPDPLKVQANKPQSKAKLGPIGARPKGSLRPLERCTTEKTVCLN